MIKKYIKGAAAIGSLLFSFSIQAQNIATFDSLPLDSSGVWIPDSIGENFSDAGATFISSYDTNWGGYWSGGFGYTNHIDTATAGFMNNYSTYTGAAYSGNQFAIVDGNTNSNALVKFDSTTKVQGFYISNTTYSALSMRDGDAFGKVFGADTLANGSDTLYDGSDVTGADWFKVTITPFHGDSLHVSESIDYFLADYRFADDELDYIVNDWRWVDLSSIPESDSLKFVLSSSDVSAYGMNTPAYFVMDDFTTGVIDGTNELLTNLISVYPNPANDFINFKIPSNNFEITIFNAFGQQVKVSNSSRIDVSDLEKGVFITSIEFDGNVINKRFIKQ